MFSFLKRKKRHYPEFISEYLNQDFKAYHKKSVNETPFIVLDCETTGTGKSDKIITIGAVNLSDRSIRTDKLLDIRLPLKSGGAESEIHGELGNAETNARCDAEILRYISNFPIVGHHVEFDIKMLNAMFQRNFPDFKLKNKVLDTLKISLRLFKNDLQRMTGGHGALQLDALCKRFDIPVENRHTALGDAFMTALLFLRLTDLAGKRGIKKISDL